MKATKKSYTDLLAVVMPRQNGTKAGIAALQVSLDRNNKEVKK